MKPFYWALIAATLAVGACASMSPEECVVADWRQIGLQDGNAGYNNQQLARHQKACTKVNITPDFNQYRIGYQAGLKNYCQPQNVFSLAMQGRGDINVCPSHQQALLAPFYHVPLDYVEAKKEVDNQIENLERIDRHLRDKLSDDERRRYHGERRSAHLRLRQAEAEYDHQARRLRDFQRMHKVY